MKKNKALPYILGSVVALLVLALELYLFCPAINIHNFGLWLIVDFAFLVFLFVTRAARGCKDFGIETITKQKGPKGKTVKTKKLYFHIHHYLVPIGVAALALFILFISSTMFNAGSYSEILKVKESDFSTDLAESVGTDSIALMDTASARMLGDREIGALSDVVSQFDVSDDYTQIDYNGKPVKVSALDYAGFFKWINHKDNGVRGYVTVDPVSMSATYIKSEGMKYVPSAFFFQDARRHMWIKYPTLMLDNLHFEIDETGKPYYVASIIEKTINLFGGETVSGCLVMDPVSGEIVRYELSEIPRWVDVVFSGDLICQQYNWYGMLNNGYLNSLFGKKDCKRVTTSKTEEDSEGESSIPDYGYVAKDGDIWIYTGITSVNGDSSNIGFLLANERTGESRYYRIAGADEKSAMAAAEGEVQEKGYQASFPSLINIDGNPTYIMVLKDAGGLVKLYAMVNVEQYNIVTTATSQEECIQKYKAALGLESGQPATDAEEIVITIAQIKYIDIDGNTYIYLIDGSENIYKAKASTHEAMLLLEPGDRVELSHSSGLILTCDIVE